MKTEDLRPLIKVKCIDLMEHCNSVQILVSVINDDGSTACIKMGWGDWYARQGMAHEFIAEDISRANAREIADVISPPPDEEWKTA